jgi:hypothetical protein
MKIHKKKDSGGGGDGGDDEEDETLECCDCSSEFVFTAGEKKFYKEKGENLLVRSARMPRSRMHQ